MGAGVDVSSSRDMMMYRARMRFAATMAVSAAYVALPFQAYFWLMK